MKNVIIVCFILSMVIEGYGQSNVYDEAFDTKTYSEDFKDEIYGKVLDKFSKKSATKQKQVLLKTLEYNDKLKTSMSTIEVRKLILKDNMILDSIPYYLVTKTFEKELLEYVIQATIDTRSNWENFITRDKGSLEKFKEKLFGEKKFNPNIKTKGNSDIKTKFLSEWQAAQDRYKSDRESNNIASIEESKGETFMVMALNIRDALKQEKIDEINKLVKEEFEKMFRK